MCNNKNQSIYITYITYINNNIKIKRSKIAPQENKNLNDRRDDNKSDGDGNDDDDDDLTHLSVNR